MNIIVENSAAIKVDAVKWYHCNN